MRSSASAGASSTATASRRIACLPIPMSRPAARSIPARSSRGVSLRDAGVGHFVAPARSGGKPVLGQGDSGDAVETLQSMLSLYGYGIDINGVFDQPTRRGRRCFSTTFSSPRGSMGWPTARPSIRCGACWKPCQGASGRDRHRQSAGTVALQPVTVCDLPCHLWPKVAPATPRATLAGKHVSAVPALPKAAARPPCAAG